VFERFTDRARRVLVCAQEEARLLRHGFIGTEHLLLGLIQEREGVAARALEELGIALADVRRAVEETIGSSTATSTGSPPFTPRAKKVLELSLREALALHHNYIGTEHILLGVIREGEGVGARVLVRLGAEPDAVRAAVLGLLAGYGAGEAAPPPGHGRGRLVRCSFCGLAAPRAASSWRAVRGRPSASVASVTGRSCWTETRPTPS